MASRESYDLIRDIKRLGVKETFRRMRSSWKHAKKLIWKDTFGTRFNKTVGCKLTQHKWYIMDEPSDYAFCTKCNKHINTEEDFKVMRRKERIKNI